jgi:hypothetical protein
LDPKSLIFTVTAGRTGTDWLSKFIQTNSSLHSIHEPIKIHDFGVKMPDIRIMRTFNEYGFNNDVKSFWSKKFKTIESIPLYSESNHTLGKCGLIEHMSNFTKLTDEVSIILLRRENRAKQAVSYLTRADFFHVTMQWQWYLSYRYKHLILNPKPFLEHKMVGMVFWYIYEIESRQEYYKLLHGDRFNFIDASLESITKIEGAESLAKSLNIKSDVHLPPPANVNKLTPSEETINHALEFENICNIDPKEIAKTFIDSGERIGQLT